jgi:hypothetical protein
MGVLPQVLEMIFEVQRKRINEKITRRIISFSKLQNTFFSFLLFFGTFLLSDLVTFLFLIHFNQFKVL